MELSQSWLVVLINLTRTGIANTEYLVILNREVAYISISKGSNWIVRLWTESFNLQDVTSMRWRTLLPFGAYVMVYSVNLFSIKVMRLLYIIGDLSSSIDGRSVYAIRLLHRARALSILFPGYV